MCLCGHVPNKHEIGPTNAWTKLSVGHENIRIRTILWCRHVHPFPNKSPYRHPIIYCPTAISFRYVKRKVRLFEIRVIATKISYEIGPSINICTIHEHVSHNNRSCATMVIYSCKWVNVPYRWNGAGAGICVLNSWLVYAWVFCNNGSIDTCPSDVFVISGSNII